MNELTTELRELEERGARCQKKTKEKEDDENVTEEKKIKEDMEAKEYENLRIWKELGKPIYVMTL